MRRSLVGVVVLALVAALSATTPAVAADRGTSESARRAHSLALRGPGPADPLVSAVAATTRGAGATRLTSSEPARASWPTDGQAFVDDRDAAAGKVVRPGSLAVGVRRDGRATGGFDVRVRDHDRALAAGVDGVMLTLDHDRGGDVASSDPHDDVELSVGYASFAGAGGGDWASRLRLVSMPACALTTPDVPACRNQTPVASSVNA